MILFLKQAKKKKEEREKKKAEEKERQLREEKEKEAEEFRISEISRLKSSLANEPPQDKNVGLIFHMNYYKCMFLSCFVRFNFEMI